MRVPYANKTSMKSAFNKTFVFSGVRIDATEPKDAELPELPDDI